MINIWDFVFSSSPFFFSIISEKIIEEKLYEFLRRAIAAPFATNFLELFLSLNVNNVEK